MEQLLLYCLQGLLAVLCAVLWFLYRDLKVKVETAQKELTDHKLHVAEKYATQELLGKALHDIGRSLEMLQQSMDKKLDRIESKLDGKQDKST